MKAPKKKIPTTATIYAGIRAAKREAMIQGFGDAFGAALGFIDAGNLEGARAICSAGRTAYVLHLRERVSHEPGGIHYAEQTGSADK